MGSCICTQKEVEYDDKSIQVTIEKELSHLDKVIDEYLIEDDLKDNDIVYQENYEKSNKHNDFSISEFLNEIEEQILSDQQKMIDENISDIEMMSFYSDSDKTFDFLP